MHSLLCTETLESDENFTHLSDNANITSTISTTSRLGTQLVSESHRHE